MANQYDNLFIHIGLPKSASTYLQSEIFPNLDCLNIPRFDPNINKLFEDYFHRPSLDYTSDVNALLSQSNGQVIFSNERPDIYTSDSRLRSTFTQMYKHLFPGAKIILIIRRQDNFIESLYANMVMNGAWYSPLFYIGKKSYSMRNPKVMRFPTVNLDYLDWLEHVTELHSLFGKENVLVLPFELLTESSTKFVKKITDFMNIPYPTSLPPAKKVNNSLCTGAIHFRRILNRFINSETNPFYFLIENPFRNSNNNLLKTISKYINFNYPLKYFFRVNCNKKIYSNKIRQEILHNYSNSNQLLQKLIDTDLEKYGYINRSKM
jgi:hypothetical protein